MPFTTEISSLQFCQGRLSLLSFFSPSHFTSVVLLPLPVVLLLHPPTQEHVRTLKPRTHACIQQEHTHVCKPSSPCGVIVFCERCKVFTFLHNSNHKPALPPLSTLHFSFSCPLLPYYFFQALSHLPALSFCPLLMILCYLDMKQTHCLCVGLKKRETFLNFLFHLALAPRFLLHIPCLPSFSSLSSPALPYFYHFTIHSNPLLASSFIPLFYMHPLLLLTSPLLPPVLYLLLSYYFYPAPFFSLSSPVLSFSPLGSRFGPVLKNCPAT